MTDRVGVSGLDGVVAWDGDNAVWPDTRERVVVLRPADEPRVSLALAQIALAHQNEDALREAASGRMVFVGYLVRRAGKIVAVDHEGKSPSHIEPGDALAALSELTQLD